MKIQTRVQLYAQFGDFWSNANVSRGIARGLAANGIPLRLWDRTGTYLGLDGVEFETGMSSPASIGCFVGYPHMSLDLLADHDVKVGFFIAESSVLPPQWAMAAARCDLVVVPSLWTKGAYVRGGVDPTKVMVVPHGLDPVFRNAWRSRVLTWGKQYPTVEEPLRFLHIAGARDFIERKGTPRLLEAFVKVAQAASVQMRLTVRTPPSPQIEALRQAADPGGKFVVMDYHDAPLPAAEMVKYLLETHWSALVQPSRAEAFGCTPVEARACGIPVIMTHGHGHRMHVEDIDTLIPDGEVEAAIQVNGIPGGLAPTVETRDIEVALCSFMDNRQMLRLAALGLAAGTTRDYYSGYDWGIVMKPVAGWLKAKSPRGTHVRGEKNA